MRAPSKEAATRLTTKRRTRAAANGTTAGRIDQGAHAALNRVE
jgi:hypothetical protein